MGGQFWHDFGIRFWQLILSVNFGSQFWHLILAVDLGGQFWRSILAVDLGGQFCNQFWQTILALDFYFVGRFRGSISALDFSSRF